MRRSRSVPAFVRPALLEGVLLCTLGGAAVCALAAGFQMHCSALVEFGLLSAIAAVSAGALFTRYAVEICGFLADYRWFEFWGPRLGTAGYVFLGLYALINGILDLAIPRRDADWISYPGLISTVVAVVVVALVLQTKYRALEDLPSRSLFESLAEDTFFLKTGAVTLAALIGHIFAPVWWLDTVTDAVFLVLIAAKVRQMCGRVTLSL